MTELITTFAADTAELEEKREISGLAAPYGETISHGGKKVRFEKGMFSGAESAHLYFNHEEGMPIGKVFHIEDTDAGLQIKARISKTPKGDEVYTLLRDGVLDKFSVGFIGQQFRQDDDVTVWEKVDLHEVSVVPRPAFQNAAVAQVHSADTTKEKELNDNTMSEANNTEVAELKEAFADLERKVVLAGTQTTEVKNEEKYSNGGQALQAIARGASAREVFAYSGSTLAGNDKATRPAWLETQLTIAEAKRPVTNLFKRGPLPDKGMDYTYPQVTGLTGTVQKHVEGADLPFLGATVGSASVHIDVWGGYTSLSRELIERSEVNVLDLHLRQLFNEYAKASEKAVKDAFVGATGTQAGLSLSSTSKAADYINVVLDGAAKIEDNALGAVAEVIVVSRDMFVSMATLVDTTNRPMFDVRGDGTNTIGEVNAVRAAGSLAGFPVVVVPTLAAKSLYVLSSEALTVRGDQVPTSLQDDNIINLTKDFSVYGYQAVEITNPVAIVKATVA